VRVEDISRVLSSAGAADGPVVVGGVEVEVEVESSRVEVEGALAVGGSLRYRSGMPLIQVFTSAAVAPSARQALLSDLSLALARHFDKPEQWVMTCLVPDVSMTFGGQAAHSCFASVKNIGRMTPDKTREMSADLSARLSKGLGVSQDRIYIEFADAVGYLWGHGGETFE
jgi:phenylpyruvate tautomerase PptA (4-oxalocrotonate tautomerase family)